MSLVRRYFAPVWMSRAWREYAYLLLGLPLGIFWAFYALAMYSVGIVLAIVWIGLAILVAMQASLRPIGGIERRLVNSLLGEDLANPEPRSVPWEKTRGSDPKSSRGAWLRSLIDDTHSWSVLGWIMARLVLGPIGFVVALLAVVMPVTLVASVLISGVLQLGWWAVPGDDPQVFEEVQAVAFRVLIASPVLIAVAPMFGWGAHAFAHLDRVLARALLGPSKQGRAAAATARAELAEAQVRIDQELHDSIGHMITMNVIQAGAGAHVFDSDPEFARQALANIEERGRAAMGELDRIVATIRGDQPEARAPLPGLGDITRLIATARAAGIDVDAQIEVTEVPPALGRTAFGIVREALTNVGKHAPGARVEVSVRRDGDALGISVVNGLSPIAADAVAASQQKASGAGVRHGVSGMRDRVTLLGGRSHIEPNGGGGFAVLAVLPLEARLAGTDNDYAVFGAKQQEASK